MNRTLLAILATGVLAATPAVASAQLSTGFSIAGGLAMPTGNFANGVSSGFNGALGLNIGAPLVPVGVRIEGGYNGFNGKNLPAGSSGDVRVLSGTVNATLGMGLPYLIGGVGYYGARATASSGGFSASSTQSAAGFNVGAGLRFPLGLLSTFAEVRYHKMMGDANNGGDISYVPITFGVQF